jgi:probable F420-dependent oxidoreductase
MRNITIGWQIIPHWGEMQAMRRAWEQAEAIGVDALYTADHFFPQILSLDVMTEGAAPQTPDGPSFEATTVMAAMAATTARPEIGCLVQANSYRNPNLTADIARTIDHLSNGRFVLGIGSGHQERDYREYGYEYGTVKSRLLELDRDLSIIKQRFRKLNPPPVRDIPIMIASMGEKIGMRIVAKHATRWHVFGYIEKVRQKTQVLRQICQEVGRDFAQIELVSSYIPHLLGRDTDPGIYLDAGITHLIYSNQGPYWDVGPVRELVRWRDSIKQN